MLWSVPQGRFMAVDFASDMQSELNYFAGPRGMGVDGLYTDCTRTTSEWLALMCAASCTSLRRVPRNALSVLARPWACPYADHLRESCTMLCDAGLVKHAR